MKSILTLLILLSASHLVNAQVIEKDSIFVKYTIYHSVDSSTVRTIYSDELKISGDSCISFDKAYSIAIEKDAFFVRNKPEINLYHYKMSNRFKWWFSASEQVSIRPLKYQNGSKIVMNVRYLSLDKNGKIDRYRRERHVYRGLIHF